MLNTRLQACAANRLKSCDYDNVMIVYKCTCVWMKDKNGSQAVYIFA